MLTELLIRGGPDAPEVLDIIDGMPRVEIASFGKRAAIECAMMLRRRWGTGGKKQPSGGWPKIKFDHQIVALARIAEAEVIYSDDSGVQALAKSFEMETMGIWDLPERPVDPQTKLPLPDPTPKGSPRS